MTRRMLILFAALGFVALLAPTSSAQQQLIGGERVYWQPSPTLGVTYMLVLDGIGVDVGPCVQTPLSKDHAFPCDAALPSTAPTDAFAMGRHSLQIFAKNANGDSMAVPVPALDLFGIGTVTLPPPPPPPPAPPAPPSGVTVAGGPVLDPLPPVVPPPVVPPTVPPPATQQGYASLGTVTGCYLPGLDPTQPVLKYLKAYTVVNDTRHIASCRLAGVKETTDGAVSWNDISVGLNGADIINAVNTTQGLFSLASGRTTGGIFRRNPSLGSWETATGLPNAEKQSVCGTACTPSAVGLVQLRSGEVIALAINLGRVHAYRLSQAQPPIFVSQGAADLTVSSSNSLLLDDQDCLWTTSGSGAFRSCDKGVTWAVMGVPTACVGSFLGLAPDGTVLCFFERNALAQWNGSAWVPVTNFGFASDWRYSWLRYGSKLYEGTSHVQNGVYVSPDNGVTRVPFNEVQPGPRLAIGTEVGPRTMGLALDSQFRMISAQREATIWRTLLPLQP